MLGTVSTNTPDSDDLAALASDPRTDWEMLHWIAEHHASLRPAVAANPGAYPELVEALGQLGDPAIDEAIRQRPDGGHNVVPVVEPAAANHSAVDPAETDPAISDPLHQMWDPYTDDLPAQRDETADIPAQGESLAAEEPDQESEPEPEANTEPEPESEQDIEPLPAPEEPAYTYPVNPAPEDYSTRAPVAATPESAPVAPAVPAYTPAPTPAPAPAPAYTPAPVAYAATPAAQPEPRREPAPEREADRDTERKGAGAKVLMAVALAVVAILGIGALIFSTLGNDEEPVAEPQPAATADASPEPEESDASEGEATAEETADEGVSEEALAEARTAVTGLASASSCEDESGDAELITEFLTLGAEGDALNAEDATMMEETFTGLQSECSTVYSASVFQGARSGVDSDAATETMETVGTDWVNRSVSIAGASTMSSFVTPDGNIQCEFDGGLRCTAYEHEYQAPAGCDAGTTYLMEVDAAAALDCSNPVAEEDRETLGVDQAATDGFMACVSLDDRVSCYNALTGAGFEISERGHYPTS